MRLGTVQSLWRYPVKGMRGEEVPHIFTAYTGVMGDRVFGVVAADGHPGHPWHTGRDQKAFILHQARYHESAALLLPEQLEAHEAADMFPGVDPVYPDIDAFKVRVESPDGKIYDDIENPAFIADLEKITGRSLRLHITPRGQFDSRPVSLISVQAAHKICEDLELPLDKRRFRANFYVEWEDQDDPFFELSLVGKTLRLGETLEMTIVERDPRCKVVTLNPDTGDPKYEMLKYLSKNAGGNAGVFAAVLKRGRVNQGDVVTLI
ncbi:MAG: MOSC domain-containing protein [Alphaproteobacteria bacterium]|jgi:uncharacterized protein YcbX